MKYQILNIRLLRWASLLLFVFGVATQATAQRLEGIATYYAKEFEGRLTSTGETFRNAGYSAASRDMPWGTILEVTNLSNGKTTQVRVNDCGPFAKGRLIDLSRAAAGDLDMIRSGEAKVRLRVIKASNSGPTCSRAAWSKKLKAQGKEIPPPPPPWDPTQTVSMAPVDETVPGPTVRPNTPVLAGNLQGLASYYPDRLQGRTTSTGEVYDRNKFTAASKTFAYGTRLEVTNIVNGARTEVVVNDCGPQSPDRILDLSRIAAQQIGVLQAGTAMVSVRILEQGTKGPTCNRLAWLKAQKANTVPLGLAPIVEPAEAQPESMVKAFVLQVGAFGNQKNAQKLAAELIGKGFTDAYAVTGEKLTKVFTGLAETKEDAEVIKSSLVQAGYAKPKVVPTRVSKNELDQRATSIAAPESYGNEGVVAPQPAPKPAKQQFDPDEMLFGVQVGAYSSKANALKMMAKLQELGFDPIYSANVGKSVRVFVGKFYFQSQAEEEKQKLFKAGVTGSSVRRVQ